MKLTSTDIVDGQAIASQFAFGQIDPANHVQLAANRNPQLSWSEVPEGTQSFVLICVDVDVPSKGDDVNQADREVPADLPRTDFYHWLLVDIPASISEISQGSCCDGVTAKGKQEPAGPEDSRQGINNYTDWFAGDADMAGDYYGYDGPCPPWNDSLIHHYHFKLYALDVPELAVSGRFAGPDVLTAMEGHVLAESVIVGSYTLNPRLA